jgi:hypothetical protein
MTTHDVIQVYTAQVPRKAQFPRPRADDFSAPDWPDAELETWYAFYTRERSRSLQLANDRTAATVDYCEVKLTAIAVERQRRIDLARFAASDQNGARWQPGDGQRRHDLVSLARDLKDVWPMHEFLEQVMRVELIPISGHRWKCRCVSPHHEDRTPSMVTLPDDSRVFCHGCRFSGDILELTGLYFGITDFAEIVRRLADVTRTFSGAEVGQ